jgi:hypothetical protein
MKMLRQSKEKCPQLPETNFRNSAYDLFNIRTELPHTVLYHPHSEGHSSWPIRKCWGHAVAQLVEALRYKPELTDQSASHPVGTQGSFSRGKKAEVSSRLLISI